MFYVYSIYDDLLILVSWILFYLEQCACNNRCGLRSIHLCKCLLEWNRLSLHSPMHPVRIRITKHHHHVRWGQKATVRNGCCFCLLMFLLLVTWRCWWINKASVWGSGPSQCHNLIRPEKQLIFTKVSEVLKIKLTILKMYHEVINHGHIWSPSRFIMELLGLLSNPHNSCYEITINWSPST